MRLLELNRENEVSLTEDLTDDIPKYAILSHTWGPDHEEVTFADVQNRQGQSKVGYEKILFCGEQARRDGINYFWVDTCCINKADLVELSEAIVSMFRWYATAEKCYVYLSDVSALPRDNDVGIEHVWETSFRRSRWFTRGWTLQELLAPKVVQFFSQERALLGDKRTLAQQIHEITTIPVAALHGTPLPQFPVAERLRWAEKRRTKKQEDRAYCLFGIFDVSMPLIYGEGVKAQSRLRKEIQEQSGGSTSFPHTHWIVPRPANPLFTGRGDLLQELGDIIHGAVFSLWDRAPCRIAIVGMGGQGKSEICLQLACRLRPITPDIAERSFLEVARKLSIPAQDWEDARQGITNLQQPWLLILDNADDPEVDYQDYFPDGTLGVVIMTTRNEECHLYGADRTIPLQGLDADEARELLLKAARVQPHQHDTQAEDATRVADLLRSHPLALTQAGVYVSRGHCTLAEYPRVYEQQRRRLLTFQPPQVRSRYRDVYTTFEVSADMLGATNTQAAQDALELLPLLAACGPSQLPLSLFEAGWRGARRVPSDLDDYTEDKQVTLLTPWHVTRLRSFLDTTADTWDSFRLTEALAVLKAFSLVSANAHDDFVSISVHTLVHAWARDRQDDGQQHQTWLRMSCLVALALRQGDFSPQDERRLQPHIEALTDWPAATMFATEPPVLIARTLMNCGWYLYEQRADAKLFALLQRILVYLRMDQCTVEPSWVGLYDLTARNLVNYARVKEAVALLEEVVKIREQTLAADHPSRLTSQHELAGAYRASGRVKEAVVLLQEVVKIQEQTLAVDHPDRLASQHELAGAYRASGRVKEAVILLQEVVKIREQTLVVDHPDRLVSQQNLAIYLWDTGERERPLSIMRQVSSIRERVLNDDHPSRQQSEEWLAYFENEVAELNMH